MTSAQILKKVAEYYASEKRTLDMIKVADDMSAANYYTALNFSKQRCLGVAHFVQYLGVEFEDIDKMFEQFKADIA